LLGLVGSLILTTHYKRGGGFGSENIGKCAEGNHSAFQISLIKHFLQKILELKNIDYSSI
jgi:hypothetical protein